MDLPPKEPTGQQEVKPYDPIPPNIFGGETWDNGVTKKSYLSARATARVIKDSALAFRISEYHLFTLLGIVDKATGYHWTSGMKRPSSMYFTRLTKLYQIHFVDGKPLVGIEWIDWGTGEIQFRSFNSKDAKRNRRNLHHSGSEVSQRGGRPTPLTTFIRHQ